MAHTLISFGAADAVLNGNYSRSCFSDYDDYFDSFCNMFRAVLELILLVTFSSRALARRRGDKDTDLALHSSEGDLYGVLLSHGRVSSKFHGSSWE